MISRLPTPVTGSACMDSPTFKISTLTNNPFTMWKATDYDAFIQLTIPHNSLEIWVRVSAIIMIREAPADDNDETRTIITTTDGTEYYVKESVNLILKNLVTHPN